jgi:hypothetical protein
MVLARVYGFTKARRKFLPSGSSMVSLRVSN